MQILPPKLSIKQCYTLFAAIVITLLLACSVHIVIGLINYKQQIIEHEFSIENHNILNAIKGNLRNLAISLSTHSNNASFIRAIKQKSANDDTYDTVASMMHQFNMVSGVYLMDMKGKIRYFRGSNRIHEIETNQQVFNALDSMSSSDNNDGRLVLIGDKAIIPGDNNYAIAFIYPLTENTYQKLDNFERVKVQTRVGFIVAIVPYNILPMDIPLSTHEGISFIKLWPYPNKDLLKDEDFKVSNIETMDLKINEYENIIPLAIITATNGNFAIDKQLQIIMIGSLIFLVLSLLAFVLEVTISSRAIQRIKDIIANVNISTKEYNHVKTSIVDVEVIDNMVFGLWEHNRMMLTELDRRNNDLLTQGKKLIEYKYELENKNQSLTNQVSESSIEMKRIYNEQKDWLSYYSIILKLSDFMDTKLRTAEEISFEISATIRKLTIPYAYCIKIDLGKNNHSEIYSQDWMESYASVEIDIDSSKRYYSAENIDFDCTTMVFPMFVNQEVSNALFFAIPNGLDFQEMQKEGLSMICKSLSNHIDNAILQSKLEKLAKIDELTGLMNRNYYETVKWNRINNARIHQTTKYRLGIFAIDLNGLKRINDSLGHVAGDWLITSCAHILREATKNCNNVEIYRIGGDEFVVIVEDPKLEQIEIIESNFKKEMEVERDFMNQKFKVSFCYGYAQSEDIAKNGSLFEEADEILYANKRSFYEKNKITR